MSTTVFVSDETSKVAQKRDFAPLFKQITLKQDINSEQSVKSFLGKPTLVVDGFFQSSDTSTTFPAYFLPFNVLSGVNIYIDKLSGFYGFKGTTVFTLQVNANRFVQGRYLLNFYPLCGSYGTTEADRKTAIHNFSLMQRTQVPGVQIDLNCETQVVLKVPFISCMPFYPLKARNLSKARSIGSVRIHPYVASNVQIPYTLFVHYEDVELIGASVPQSSTDSEQRSKNMGTIETNLRKVTVSSRYASKLPVIGNTIQSIGWVSDIMANVASVWGWSKPTQNTAPMPMFRHRGLQNMNVDGADISAKMSFSVKNELATMDGIFGSKIDEMTLKYIQSIPSFYSNTSWDTTMLKEATLTTINLNPSNFNNLYTDNGNANIQVLAPCSVPILNFAKYRGSFNLTFKIVKTEFHSGRLLVAFHPRCDDGGISASNLTYALSYYCHRHIIDIRYGNEWTFNFPYVSDYLYKDTGVPYGQVVVFIENPLVAPSTVSNSVNILIEVSGGDDLEYACPTNNTFLPYYPTAPQSSNGGQFACDKIEEVIGTATADDEDVLLASLSIGEQVQSYRQILKRFELRPQKNLLPKDVYYDFVPYAMPLVSGVGTAGAPTFPNICPDSIARFGLMFAMGRGSMRCKLFDPLPAASGSCVVYADKLTTTVAFEYNSNSLPYSGIIGPIDTIGQPTGQVTVNDGLTAEIQTPMYTKNYAFPICDVMLFSLSQYQYAGAAPPVIINVTNVNTTSTHAPQYMRAIGDDFSFGYFISTIPLIAAGSNYTNTWS